LRTGKCGRPSEWPIYWLEPQLTTIHFFPKPLGIFFRGISCESILFMSICFDLSSDTFVKVKRLSSFVFAKFIGTPDHNEQGV